MVKRILSCAVYAAAAMATLAQINVLESGFSERLVSKDETARLYLTPVRLIALPDSMISGVNNAEALLEAFDGQLSTGTSDVCVLSTRAARAASVLLDFGREIYGSVELAAPIRSDQNAINVHICCGESVSEAMSSVAAADATATNQHSLRDFNIGVPWLGTVETGNSGFRFVRIDLLDKEAELPLKAVRAILKYRDIPYRGMFRSSDERLNRIWDTGAYTVHLNMQNYLWDGVKRDRLVWVGDMHPEFMTIASVFGDYGVVRKSLDFARDSSPLPSWMNGIAAYSMWWILIHRDLYMYGGDLDYLREQTVYMKGLLDLLAGSMDGNKENLQGGQRLLDWPTSEKPNVIHAGYQALMVMTMQAGIQIAGWTGDEDMEKLCRATHDKLLSYRPSSCGSKQGAAMLLLARLADHPQGECNIITERGAEGFSTFFGYYMLKALAEAGMHDEATRILSDYWGAMLDLGATTFWEDLDYTHALKAAPIDSPVPEGAFDIHAISGDYCYKGYRHSFCHGWASGPTPWLSQYVLGVSPLEPGCRKVLIDPHMAHLDWVEGSFPTPYGDIAVRHEKDSSGKILTTFDAPDDVEVILSEKVTVKKK